MGNNVVQAVAQRLALDGYTVLCFNFRGVGRSSGRATWSGTSERSDFAASVQFARAIPGVTKVFLVGYSFGAAVGCSCNDLVDGYVAISYPYGWLARCALGGLYSKADSSLPKLFLIGDADQFAGTSSLMGFASKLQEPKDIVVFPGVDHFWQGDESLLLDPIRAFLVSAAGAAARAPAAAAASNA